jgi:hypothetical protein
MEDIFMYNKRTLADLMDNDFFIDFDTTTPKAKVVRKNLNESLKRRRALIESINESEVESCYKRVCASAAEERGRVMDDPADIMLAVKVSKEHLKKALKLGAFSTYEGEEPHTVPAQYVESVDFEFLNNIMIDEDYCQLAVQLHGEYNDESVNDYIGDVCFVQFREYPAFETEEEALEFFEKEIRPNATKIAEEMIDEAWAASGCTDYEGITELSGEEDEEPEDDAELFKADSDSWRSLLDQADSLLKELVRKSSNGDYDDGDGYWVSEYTIWCNRYLYYSDELNNEAKLKALCDEYSKKLPGITFYYDIDADEELSEIGYKASKEIEESVEKPNNAVVDCKVNKVIAHCEDEKPVDCLGKKKPLEKPLTEDTEENVIYFSKAINDNVSVPAADLDQFKKIDEEACKIWEDADAAGLIDGREEEQKLCDQYDIVMFSGVELLDSLTTKAGISWELVDDLEEAKSAQLKETSYYVKGETTSYWAEVDNSTKATEAKGVTKSQAFKDIMTFINSLTQEEIDNLSMQWIYDKEKPGDEDGDVILQLDSLSEFCEREECSADNYDRQDFEQNRYPQNWDDEDDYIVKTLVTVALGLPWYC